MTIDDAIIFAAKAHAGQTRKDSTLPYITHPLEVMKFISKWGVTSETMFKAAVCHDVIEDCPRVLWTDVVDAIGYDAANLVEELTRVVDPREDVARQKADYLSSWIPWQNGKSVESLVIKIADRVCNTSDFMVSRSGYAQKYWWKAKDLVEAARNRRMQVSEKFGSDVASRMLDSIDLMSRHLGDPTGFLMIAP